MFHIKNCHRTDRDTKSFTGRQFLMATNSGKNKRMAHIFLYPERKMFQITAFVIIQFLGNCSRNKFLCIAKEAGKHLPFCELSSTLKKNCLPLILSCFQAVKRAPSIKKTLLVTPVPTIFALCPVNRELHKSTLQ